MAKQLLQVVNDTPYPIEAFAFVQRGLDFTVRRLYGPPPEDAEQAQEGSRHVSGRQLCEGLRDYAIEQYGMMARSVLRRWRVLGTEDFGHIVFAMIDAGLMHKTDEDSIDDFVDVYDFADAFLPRLVLVDIHPTGRNRD